MELELKEIVLKLTGKVYPTYESNEDEKRLSNLNNLCELTYNLVEIIRDISEAKNKTEYSARKIGERAYQELKDIRDNINDI